jgi:hypothetical protein
MVTNLLSALNFTDFVFVSAISYLMLSYYFFFLEV